MNPWHMVMPANRGAMASKLNTSYSGRLGLLFSPPLHKSPTHGLPYALDNGRYPCWTAGRAWDENAYTAFLDKTAKLPYPPLWVLVPDVVADKDATLTEYARWIPKLCEYGWPLAVAVQDGMMPGDVERLSPQPEVVFVGGTTKFKWRTLPIWCRHFPRVHVGRVNTYKLVWRAAECGAESSDGTGWWHDEQHRQLERFLDRSSRGLKRDDRRRLIG